MQHYFANGTPSGATVGTASTKVLDARSGRCYAVLINDSDATIYLALGVAAEMNKGIRLNANGGAFEISGDEPFRGEIYAICAAGNKNLCIFEA